MIFSISLESDNFLWQRVELLPPRGSGESWNSFLFDHLLFSLSWNVYFGILNIFHRLLLLCLSLRRRWLWWDCGCRADVWINFIDSDIKDADGWTDRRKFNASRDAWEMCIFVSCLIVGSLLPLSTYLEHTASRRIYRSHDTEIIKQKYI